MARPRVIVAGGGYVGLAAIKVLRARDDLAVTLIDPSPTHQLIPELPAALRPDGTVREHTVPFSTLLRDSGVVHRTDSITGVRAAERTVVLRSGAHLTFDWLIVSVGSMTRWSPIPGLRESALPFRTAADAGRLRERLEGRCGLRVVILGGGLTGVEVAGELAARHQVHVVEMAPRILPEVGPGLSRYGSQVLQHNDVEISTATQVDRVDPHQLVIKPGQSIPFDVLVGTSGIAPPDIAWAGVDVDERGYPVADDWGEVAPSVFVAGDVFMVRRQGEVVPQTAQLAVESGGFVARTIVSRISHHEKGPPFQPRFKGLLVALDDRHGVGWVVNEGLAVKGYGARALKGLVFTQYRFKLASAFPGAPAPD